MCREQLGASRGKELVEFRRAATVEVVNDVLLADDALVDLLRDIGGTLQAADPMKERIIETLAKAAAAQS